MDAVQSHNSADLPLVTLDNNAIVALRENEPDAPAVNELLAMNRDEQIVINITLSTALEAGPSGLRRDWQEHIAWFESLGITRSNIFTGPRTIGFINPSDPGVTIFDPWLESQFNMRLHQILFPNVPFSWYEFRDTQCGHAGLPLDAMAEYELAQDLLYIYIPPTPRHPQQPPTPHLDALTPEEQAKVRELYQELKSNWHNAKNDAIGLYNHLTVAAHTSHAEWSVFVSNDRNFRKATKLPKIRAMGFRGEILPPAEAVAFLRSVILDRDFALAPK